MYNNGKGKELHLSTTRQSIFESLQVLEFDVTESLGPLISILDDFDRLGLRAGHISSIRAVMFSRERMYPTLRGEKNCSRSVSVRSKARFPTKAV
jgi:hypothetical protein